MSYLIFKPDFLWEKMQTQKQCLTTRPIKIKNKSSALLGEASKLEDGSWQFDTGVNYKIRYKVGSTIPILETWFSGDNGDITFSENDFKTGVSYKKKFSAILPRRFARYEAFVEEVYLKRLQSTTQEELILEGFEPEVDFETNLSMFLANWDIYHEKRYPSNENPYVLKIRFKNSKRDLSNV